MNNDPTVIRTEGLTRDFKSVRAVDGLSITVPRGAIYGFLGPNGSGKTTTIRMLLGLLEPTSGKANVLGFDVGLKPDDVRLRCGALLEYNGLYERLSAEDNLEFYARIARMSAADRQSRIKEVLQSFGLWDRRKDTTGTWSRGMKQKLAVARAMMHHPELVFLDEPTAGMDPLAASALREELATLVRREGMTVFLTTHNLSEVEKLCARIAVIRNGKLLAEGNPDELRSRSGSNRVEISGRGFNDTVVAMLRARPEIHSAVIKDNKLVLELNDGFEVSTLVPVLTAAGVQIEEMRKEKYSLEDVFLTLVETPND
jgi:ABC-2 type transport system ATP-binding protein